MRRIILSVVFLASTLQLTNAGPIITNSRQLPYDIKTASCDEIIASTNTNRNTKMFTANLYMHGKVMGKRCFAPKPIKAFEIYTELGMTRQMNGVLNDLEQRASSGNHHSQTVLKKLARAGYITLDISPNQ